MRIELHEIPVRELVSCYVNNDEEGVVGYGGRLNIRPKYQREFVYADKQRDAVIDTVRRGFPLNVMYWAVNDDGTLEVLDGQQRTVSICEYVAGNFSIRERYFHTLQPDEREQILDYRLMVYWCAGSDSEKLDWFRTINIAGERLTDQELRNAVYTGPWLTDAKRHFSKRGCAAYAIGADYLSGNMIRQEYLETAIKWKSKGAVAQYMADHQHDPNANELWLYFQQVIQWVRATFVTYRREMKSVDWGALYDAYGTATLDTAELERRVAALIQDDDVTAKRGIYPFVLNGDERTLSIRQFTPAMKRAAYERQQGNCLMCQREGKSAHHELANMEADHITPWSQGGRTTAENCQLLCRMHNRLKSDK